MQLTTHILLRLVIPITAGITIISLSTLISLYVLTPQWTTDINVAIKEEELGTLGRRVEDRAAFLQLYFDQVANDMDMMHDYAVSLHSGDIPIQSYYDPYFAVGGNIPPGGLITSRGNMVNTFTSSWFNKHMSEPTNVTQFRYTLDNVFRPMYKADVSLFTVYMGFEDGGIMFYPFVELPNFPTIQIQCYPDNNIVVGFDVRCREWYRRAAETENIYFTAPYRDAVTGKLLISAAKRVHVNGSLIGVLGLDIVMSDLESNISSSTVLENGYAFLIDHQRYAVVYPNLNRDNLYTLEELEEPDHTDLFEDIVTRIVNRETGNETYRKGGDLWRIAYTPVSGRPYMIGMAVPESDIDRPVNDLDSSVSSILAAATTVMVIITVIIAVCLGAINVYFSRKVLCSTIEMQSALKKLTKLDYDAEIGDAPPASAEMQIISSNFQNLLTAVRFGNQAYYQGDLDKAMTNYAAAEAMMNQMKNVRGQGVCHNNIASVYRQKGDMQTAQGRYNKAISNARQMMNETKDQEKLKTLQVVLAGRIMNLGVLSKDMNNFDDAKSLFREALDLHRHADNAIGIAEVSGNLGQLYVQMSRPKSAKKLFDESLETLQNCNDNIAKQYAFMNMGIYFYSIQQYEPALQWFKCVLDFSDQITHDVQVNTLTHIAGIYQITGQLDKEAVTRQFLPGPPPKDVYFVLDYSGSMAGGFIDACRKSLVEIVTQYLDVQDRCALSVFNRQVRTVFELQPLNAQFMKKKIKSLKSPGGGTAFYDAVKDAMIHARDTPSDHSEWIVALTDGDDNNSNSTVSDLIKLLNNVSVKIIVITVGSLRNELDIARLCKAGSGHHIKADGNSDSIRKAFQQVQQLISKVHMEKL